MSPSRASLAAVLLCVVAACTPASPRSVPDSNRLAGSTRSPLPSPTRLASSPSPSPVAGSVAGSSPSIEGSPYALDHASVDGSAGFPGGDGADDAAGGGTRIARTEVEPGAEGTGEPGAEGTGGTGAQEAREPAAQPATTAEATATPAPACPAPPIEMSPVAAVYHGPTSRKVVALTFDDGHNSAVTQRILGILVRERVNATFFPTGRAVADAPGLWRSVAAAGFPIANHTYAHRTLPGQCYATQLSDLLRQRAVLDGLGIPSLAAMRPPGGAWDQITRHAAHAAGAEAVVLWDVDTRDWDGLSARAIARRALAGHEGSIILMHTFPANTAAALPAIISGFRARGYGFVTVGTMLGLAGSVPY